MDIVCCVAEHKQNDASGLSSRYWAGRQMTKTVCTSYFWLKHVMTFSMETGHPGEALTVRLLQVDVCCKVPDGQTHTHTSLFTICFCACVCEQDLGFLMALPNDKCLTNETQGVMTSTR